MNRILLLRARLVALNVFAFTGITFGQSPATQPASSSAAQPTHDRDPWIFRCVLDGNPRTVVVSLGNHYWAAYDANAASLVKVWHGEVDLTGAVYDMRHGPQPMAKGKVLLERPAAENASSTMASSDSRYRGYTEHDGLATFHYDRDGYAVSETPSLGADDSGSMTFCRTFVVKPTKDEDADRKGPLSIVIPVSSSVQTIRLTSGSVRIGSDDKSRTLAAPAELQLEPSASEYTFSVVGSDPVTIGTSFKPQ